MSDAHHSLRWTRLRNSVMRKGKFLCANPWHWHRDLRVATEVHHIIPVEQAPNLMYNIDNLVPLCSQCHDDAHRALRTTRGVYWAPFGGVEAFYGRLAASGFGDGSRNLGGGSKDRPRAGILKKMHGVFTGVGIVRDGRLVQ